MQTTEKLQRMVHLAPEMPPVCRLGLATRGNTFLSAEDVRLAMGSGINYLNWSGHEDGMSQAIEELGSSQRAQVVVALQFSARTVTAGKKELKKVLSILQTGYIDVLTIYYMESEAEWCEIMKPGGVLGFLHEMKQQGKIRLIGLTTHQRVLGAKWAQTGQLDLLMIRYNGAHPGAEEDVFPITRRLKIPVVGFTCMRWGAMLRSTPDDPPGFKVPTGRDWYRFSLSNPDVAVALMAPNGRQELLDNLSIIKDWKPLDSEYLKMLKAHGQRIRKHAGHFP